MLLPTGHKMMQSIYTLKEYLKKIASFPTIHYICSVCGKHVSKTDKSKFTRSRCCWIFHSAKHYKSATDYVQKIVFFGEIQITQI